MKTLYLTFLTCFIVSTGWAQDKPKTHVYYEMYAYLFVDGHVEFANKKNSYLIVVRDTSSMSIKYADSIFVIHISPKFVTKINDSTYTFKQLK